MKSLPSKDPTAINFEYNKDLDQGSSEEVILAIKDKINSSTRTVHLTLGPDSYVYSGGIGLLFRINEDLKKRGIDLKLTLQKPGIMKLFKDMELGKILNFTD